MTKNKKSSGSGKKDAQGQDNSKSKASKKTGDTNGVNQGSKLKSIPKPNNSSAMQSSSRPQQQAKSQKQPKAKVKTSSSSSSSPIGIFLGIFIVSLAVAGISIYIVSEDVQEKAGIVYSQHVEPVVLKVRNLINNYLEPQESKAPKDSRDIPESEDPNKEEQGKMLKEKEEREQREREEHERKEKERKEELERVRKEKEEAEQLKKKEEDRKRKEREEVERKAEKERKEKERKAEEERKNKEKEEAERKSEFERKEKERKAEEERKRKEKEEAEKKAEKERKEKLRKEEEERQKREKEAERQAEIERKKKEMKEEEDRKKKEKEDAERKAELERKEKERKAKEAAENERKEKERKEKEERERKEKEEAERKAENERKEKERKEEEERERKEKEEAERKADKERKEKEKKVEEERKRREKEEAERREKERKAEEERKRKEKEEAEKKAAQEKKERERKEAAEREKKEMDKKVNEEKKSKAGKEAKVGKDEPQEEAANVLYEFASITNDNDFKIKDELDEADRLYDEDDYEGAIRKYDSILRRSHLSPRAMYGKGLTLDKLGFKHMSNEYLEQAINFLGRLLLLPDVPDELFLTAGRKLAERQHFRGWGSKAVKTFTLMLERFPEDIKLRCELGVTYMMIGRNAQAKDVFEQVLQFNPNSGFAKAHIGFIYKTSDNNWEKAIPLLRDGIESGEEGTSDGRFYIQLGDALIRIGQEPEARHYFKEAETKGLFMSRWQRSLYNVKELTGRPFWTAKQLGYGKYIEMLEKNWKTIRDEGLAQLDEKSGSFLPEEENLRDTGEWKQFTLYQQGRKNKDNCAKVPKTCAIIDQIPPAAGCKRGQVKFSVMSPGIHVWPHTGPTNCRLRSHLGLVVPEGPVLRVVNETRTWTEGKVMTFDDSFEHEVWHKGTKWRLILIVDFWHPELTDRQRRTLSPI